MNGYKDKLKTAIESGQGILVLGTGVSKALTGGAPSADWVGLIRNGIDRLAIDNNLSGWTTLQEMSLEDAMSRNDLDALVGVASQIAKKLKSQGDQSYSDWLRESVGSLKVKHSQLATALDQLNLPILTTNYDQLIEKALRRSSVDWSDAESMREVFKGENPAVGHLHGVWNRPETVIFSESDYERVMNDQPGQFVQQSHYSTKSFIYVGFGGGLDDPNFARLLDRHNKMFPQSRGDHFRLCQEQDVPALTAFHAAHDIRVISYGSQHSDLEPFISSYGPPKNLKSHSQGRDNLAFAREAILEPIRTETVVGSHLENISDCDLSDLTVPPVFLPVPHEQFASMQDLEDDLKPRRIEAESIFIAPQILILAGEELCGLTTALRWVVARAAFERPGVAPIFVDARNCTLSRSPLEHQVRRESLLHRLIDHKKEPIPNHVLAVDNLLPRDSSTYQQMIDDLVNSTAEFIVIGTRQGDEQRLAQDIQGHQLGVQIAYVGKLGRPEISSLVQIVAPSKSDTICDGVMDVLRREHLPRNPFTVSLLISLFVQLGGSGTHSSETAVLDDYVSLLLGRNGPYLDARYSLNPQNRETVLAELAKVFVHERKGALAQADAIANIRNYFQSVGWKEDPLEALESFRDMRVLRVSNGLVQFQQSSYLHFFAAKAAMRDEAFLQKLLDETVFYGPIVRHYAALIRNSEVAVNRVFNLLQEWPTHAPSGNIYGKIERSEAPESLGSVFQGSVSEDEEQPGEENKPDQESTGEEEDDYDFSDDTDRVPFPLEDQSKMSKSMRMLGAVDLASRVLRDSDQLANVDLKTKVFQAVLIAWGLTLDQIEKEAVFEEPAKVAVAAFASEGKISPEKQEDLIARIAIFIPTFVIFSGVASCLSSRKLLLTYEEAISDPDFAASEYGMPIAAMFAFDLNDRDWAKNLPDLVHTHGDRWIVSEFIGMLATIAFGQQELSADDELSLKEFLRERAIRRYTFKSDRERNIRIANYVQNITRERALNRRQRFAIGTSTASKVLEQ